MQNPEFNDSPRANEFLHVVLEHAASSAPVDEVNLEYEAALLDRVPVVIIICPPRGVGFDEWRAGVSEKRSVSEIRVVKGGDQAKRYFRGEIDSLDWKAVVVSSFDAAGVLEKRLIRAKDANADNVIQFPLSRS